MPVVVHTARVSYGGADRLDVTRQSAGPDGLPFAPSWAIVRPILNARARWGSLPIPNASRHYALRDQKTLVNVREEAALWDTYVAAYLGEMRDSYRRERRAWEAVLARQDVTFCCFCRTDAHCHRTLLAGIYAKLGATIAGERGRNDARGRTPLLALASRKMPASDPDALVELSLAIRQGSTMSWVLKYQRPGTEDPVQAAWAACTSGTPMREVLERVSPALLEQALVVLGPHWQSEDHVIGDSLSCCARVMRLAVPTGPTLDALLAAMH